MDHILMPLRVAGIKGVVMKDGKGIQHRVHPILAVYVGDYPEQVLVTGVKTGECPKCDIIPDELGSPTPGNGRDLQKVHAALACVDTETYHDVCANAGIKPIYHPFWERLPYVNIYHAITPDILHQIHQGILKHLLSWLTRACGATEINARCQRLSPNYHIRVFPQGITGLSRVTGKEHDLMCRILLGLVIGVRLSDNFNPARLVRAVRAFLDFLFLAHLPRQTSQTLHRLDHALKAFHENKSIFIDLGIRDNFKIPKLHSLHHYITAIKLFGSTDNYNTQYTERLHADLTKPAYRASNARDELPQMTRWLERREKIYQRSKHILTRQAHQQASDINHTRIPVPCIVPWQQMRMTRHPSVQRVPIEDLNIRYGATDFRNAFAWFIVQQRRPGIRSAQLEREIPYVNLPFTTVSVYHRIKFRQVDQEQKSSVADVLHIQPSRHNKKGHIVAGRFDTALLHNGQANQTGIRGKR